MANAQKSRMRVRHYPIYATNGKRNTAAELNRFKDMLEKDSCGRPMFKVLPNKLKQMGAAAHSHKPRQMRAAAQSHTPAQKRPKQRQDEVKVLINAQKALGRKEEAETGINALSTLPTLAAAAANLHYGSDWSFRNIAFIGLAIVACMVFGKVLAKVREHNAKVRFLDSLMDILNRERAYGKNSD